MSADRGQTGSQPLLRLLVALAVVALIAVPIVQGATGGTQPAITIDDFEDGETISPATLWTHNDPDERRETDAGGPSRYYKVHEWRDTDREMQRLYYTSKATKSERTLDGRIANAHPTVKPKDLMKWLVRLVTREGQIVLDPFAGSGTTCAAAKDLGREFVGIEKQPKWADVARVRVGLTPEDPARVRDDDTQQGLEAFTDGGESDA